ncbi:MAG: hypothetical protein IID01_10275 [Chloroflexi bacterium]|nr:hypothetical protein [Chloroflexota bacterium]
MSNKADRQPGPGKTECSNCPGAYFKNVKSHQFMARCAVPSSKGAEASTPAPAQLTLEEKPMSDCVDCKLKDRDIQDRDKEIVALKKAAEPQAPNLAEALAHAQAGGCSNCTAALQEFSQDLVAKAIPELSDEAVRALAIERKVIPETITVEMPARS